MNEINLISHTIKIQLLSTTLSFEPSGSVARVEMEEAYRSTLDLDEGYPVDVITRKTKKIINLPEPKPGFIYIVSSMVLAEVKDRNDVFAPDTGDTAIRDDRGFIKAVTRLVASN